uniref:7TM GPCR serpentine receptor class x (Srx) domain-containing protein n=2 Tax=Meloidogyne javanica TaxID=6303 RepID=A0A915MEK0_MELJA
MSSFSIYGIIELTLSIILLAVQAVTLPHFMIHAEYRKVISYQLMFIIGVFEAYLIIGTGVMPFFKYIGILGYWSERITGALYEAALDVLFIMNLALALNSESAWELMFYKFLFAIFGLITAGITLLFISPYCGLYLDGENNCFRYNKELKYSIYAYHFESKLYLIVTICCFIIYCGIVLLIKVNAPKVSQFGNSTLGQNRRNREMRILIQSFIQYVLFLFPLAFGMIGAEPGWSMIDYYGLITIIEIIFFGLNPILYFISLS